MVTEDIKRPRKLKEMLILGLQLSNFRLRRMQQLCNGQKTVCFCFLFGGPGPSEAAGGGPLTERLKTLGPVYLGMRTQQGRS